MKRKKGDIKRIINKGIFLEEIKINDKNQNTLINKNKSSKKDNPVVNSTPIIKKPKDKSVEIKRLDKIANFRYVRNNPRIKKPEIIEYSPVSKVKKPVTIVVTAYKTSDYIEECLDSIENQTYFKNNDDFEVLLGIDDCKTTLDKVMEIRDKYRNLRIFMMDKNVGTFITSNTLIGLMNTENYIRFDSDDYMLPEMVNEIMQYINDYQIIKFSYYNFNVIGEPRLKKLGNPYAAGVIYFNKEVFDIYGGYQPWVCTSEGEILKRIGDDLKTKEINLGLFHRRIHDMSLTQNEKTGMKSEIRKIYHKKIERNVKNKLKKIKRVTGKYVEK